MRIAPTPLVLFGLLSVACSEREQASPSSAPPASISAQCESGWCLITPGKYTKGSPTTEVGRAAFAEGQAEIQITRPFILQQFEASVEFWDDSLSPSWASERGHYFPEEEPSNPKRPLAALSWYEAARVANRLSEQHGLPKCYELSDCKEVEVISADIPIHVLTCGTAALAQGENAYDCDGYRLPTQAEWEYAARAGTQTASYGGDQDLTGIEDYQLSSCIEQASLAPIAWYCWNSKDTLHLGGKKRPNAFGLYDMLGNIDEWGHGNFRPWGDPTKLTKDPLGELDPADTSRVTLGGTFRAGASVMRSAWNYGETLVGTFGAGVRLAHTVKNVDTWKETLP
ncbi:MAG: formylglycine-generating enzyme family protein [Polyangiaceae bacterium]